ncbi:heavy-metal-associated domain-containing protein [Flavobacterium algicola]|uniref:heavy-metal-associated domain-containing protein n=1 Tax=Flavobacterium algicola TaxID=556529 RepID=UPI001EFD655C|nr:heavy-metal-associated domain-containing protein [Flavobacterium algicola]MCG9792229.1 heavy-metal-associated domain-containing protein [Flavobacterium algicola]
MCLLSNNVIPGTRGTAFGTDAKEEMDLKKVQNSILSIEGIIEVLINFSVFPREFTVFSNKMIPVHVIESKAKSVGFHAITKDPFHI